MSQLSDAGQRRPLETSEKVLAVAAAAALLLVLLQHTGVVPLPGPTSDVLEGLTIGLVFAVVVNAVLRLARVEG